MNKLKEQIRNLAKNIEKKESELDAMRQQLDELEKQLKYSQVNFLIKVSDSSKRLAEHREPSDIMIDIMTDEHWRVYARSAHERREYARELFEKYLEDRQRVTVCSCSDEALNVIGGLIEEHEIIPDDIGVVLYNDDNPDGLVCHYDRHGYLDNWPIGALM